MFVVVKLKEMNAQNCLKKFYVMKILNTTLTLSATLTPGHAQMLTLAIFNYIIENFVIY